MNKNVLNKGRRSQNLVEVVLIVPLLIILLLAIMEYAVFQRNVATVQDIALEAAVAASKYYVNESAVAGDPFTENTAVSHALQIVQKRISVFGLPDITFVHVSSGSGFGKRPFALYKFNSTKQISYRGKNEPVIIFTLDYRDPVRNGVSTQLIFHYRLALFGFKMGLPSGRTIVFIPDVIQLSSTQTKQYVHY